jgi:NitT/TauT family transport system substrate-binding protein
MATIRSPRRRQTVLAAALVLLLALLAACGGDDGGEASTDDTSDEPTAEAIEVRLGYFPNITHAPAIIGDLGGYFEEHLPEGGSITTSSFNAGPEAVQALFADSLDLSFIGPNPAINAYAQSDGAAIRIVSGTTSGGAFLVVREGIDRPEDLEGTKLATPQLGNTQDVALRAWLKDFGFTADDAGGGDVSILPQANGEALAAFIAGDIDGAWVPEPWATRFIQEGGAKVLIEESDLWPEGDFVTTHLIVRTEFLEDHPDVVKGIIEGLADAIDLTENDPVKAKELTNQGIEAITDKPLSAAVMDAAWENLRFTLDPIAKSLATSKDDAVEAGLLEDVELDDIYDLTVLNEVLADRGEPEVQGL